MSGDPHEFEPSANEIKKLLSADFLLAGPHELNPWIEKIGFQRKKLKKGETFTLKLDQKFLNLYIGGNHEALSHFWLYPKVFCDFKMQLDNRIIKDLAPSQKANNDFCQKEAEAIESDLKSTLSKINLPIILTHDALLPLLKTLAPNAQNVVAIKGSGHHTEATPQSVKFLYDALKSPRALWIVESGIHVPENILAKKRKNDFILELDTAHSKGQKYFQVLEELNLKLKGLN
jgi:ABC-type Zn uptake system ZnuABC Zn-binding protein ZnuA